MQTIKVELKHGSYPVYLGQSVLTDASLWRAHLAPGKILLISNETVAPLYLDDLRASLSQWDVAEHIIADGEQHKSHDTWFGIIDRLVRTQARRDATIIALGGGVVGDISGFAAATYMRGIRFIQAPTTLLAQVDASVGGKTGINHAEGKNLVGAFHQPAAVIIDTETLLTLPQREFRAGLAEVVKYGAIMDNGLLSWLETTAGKINSRQADALLHLVHQSVLNKARVVATDERETGMRAILNFGHSFGHALETLTNYTGYLHGEAVAIGMVIAARLSEKRGLCEAGAAERLSNLLRIFDLPVGLPRSINPEHLLRAMELDKKATADTIRLILLSGLGQAVIDADSSRGDILAAIKASGQD